MSRRAFVSTSMLGAALLASSLAQAQPTPCPRQAEVEALENEGLQLRERRRDAEALAVFRRSYELCRGARALARAALAEGGLGLWVDANRDMTNALRVNDPWVIEHMAQLRRNLDLFREHLGELELLGTGPAGEVLINGRSAGAWPSSTPLSVVAGSVTFEVRVPGYLPARGTVEVRPGVLAREQVSLVPVASTPGTGPALSPPSAPSQGVSWQVPAGWTAVGLAAAGVGVGVAGLLHAQARRSTYDNDARCSPRETDATYCASIIDGVDAGRAMTIAGFVSGGVLAVLGTVLLVTAPSRSSGSGRAWSCAPAAGGGGGGLTCAVRF